MTRTNGYPVQLLLSMVHFKNIAFDDRYYTGHIRSWECIDLSVAATTSFDYVSPAPTENDSTEQPDDSTMLLFSTVQISKDFIPSK